MQRHANTGAKHQRSIVRDIGCPGNPGVSVGVAARGRAARRAVAWCGVAWCCRDVWRGLGRAVGCDAHPLSPSQRLLAESTRRRRGGGMHSARGYGFGAEHEREARRARDGGATSMLCRRIHRSPPSPSFPAESTGRRGVVRWIRRRRVDSRGGGAGGQRRRGERGERGGASEAGTAGRARQAGRASEAGARRTQRDARGIDRESRCRRTPSG